MADLYAFILSLVILIGVFALILFPVVVFVGLLVATFLGSDDEASEE